MLYSLGKILGKRKAQLVPQLHIFQVEADILLLSNSCASESRLSSFVVYSHCHSISCSNTDSQSCHILFCLAFMSAHFQNDASSWAGKCPAKMMPVLGLENVLPCVFGQCFIAESTREQQHYSIKTLKIVMCCHSVAVVVFSHL